MKKAILFTALGVSSLTLLAAIPLSQAASQLWKPEVAHAAKVTAHLFKTKSFNPITLARQNRVSQTAPHPLQGETAPTHRPTGQALSASLRPTRWMQ
jgi:hypothetical protein